MNNENKGTIKWNNENNDRNKENIGWNNREQWEQREEQWDRDE